MSETLYTDLFENEIVLTDTVKLEIFDKHPEVEIFFSDVSLVLKDPDEIRVSTRDVRSIVYYRYQETVLNGKWIAIVVKRIDRHFISTIYVTDKVKNGDVIWKRSS